MIGVDPRLTAPFYDMRLERLRAPVAEVELDRTAFSRPPKTGKSLRSLDGMATRHPTFTEDPMDGAGHTQSSTGSPCPCFVGLHCGLRDDGRRPRRRSSLLSRKNLLLATGPSPHRESRGGR